ncbi:DNA polymerase III subunit chi [Candidatus Profftia sp. (ex Adelges kitamiensis)]|uniref:DNA polymerase III subunit chi n=1 Tax=Candidatus Profftia sp. (ex Adelges kitamiensis) TaxID=2864218 RepID=UPI001CE2E272|nr:DNA polymerase III subunit chi [Candidatus Profftia sp. (ex Adelges kitamiensis)]
MKQATFHILESNQINGALDIMEELSCDLAAEQWRLGKSIFIACKNKDQAVKLDNALWDRKPYQFLPHNLIGEGPYYGAPIVLSWPGNNNNIPKELMICLQHECVDFITNFNEVIDFVPYENNLKQLARERYKIYRKIGFQVITLELSNKYVV